MAQPITWRNVDAPDLRGSAGLMGVSQAGINEGFKQLQGVLHQQQQVDEANWDQVKKNNTDAFMNRLMATKTPEEMVALQASGELGQMLTQFGAQVDSSAARAAQDNRMGILQGRAEQDIRYKNVAQDAQDAPILNRLQALALQDPIAAAAEINESGLSARGRASFAEQMRKITGENVANERGNIDFNNKQLMAPLEREAKKASIAQSLASAASANADVGYKHALSSKLTHDMNKEKEPGNAEAVRALKALEANGPMSAGTIDTKEGMAAVVDWVNKNVSGDAQKQDILYNISKRAQEGIVIGKDEKGKPVKAPIPATVVIQSIMASTENPAAMIVPGWSRRGDDMDNTLLESMKDPELLKHIAAVEQARGNLTYPYLLKHAERVQANTLKSSLPARETASALAAPKMLQRMQNPNTPEKERKSIAKQILNRTTGPQAWDDGPY